MYKIFKIFKKWKIIIRLKPKVVYKVNRPRYKINVITIANIGDKKRDIYSSNDKITIAWPYLYLEYCVRNNILFCVPCNTAFIFPRRIKLCSSRLI